MDPDGDGSASWVSGLDVNWTPLLPDDLTLEWPLETDNTFELATPEEQEWAGMHQFASVEPPLEEDPLSLFEGLGESDPDPFSAYNTFGQEAAIESPSTCGFSFSSSSSGVARFSPALWESPLTPDTPVELCPSITWSEFHHSQSTTQLVSPEFLVEGETLHPTAGQHVPVRSKPRSGNRRTGHRKSNHSSLPARERRRVDPPEKCSYCDKRCQYQAALKRHIQTNHSEVLAPRIFPCDECDRRYTRSDRLYRHGINKHGWPPRAKRRPATVTGQ